MSEDLRPALVPRGGAWAFEELSATYDHEALDNRAITCTVGAIFAGLYLPERCTDAYFLSVSTFRSFLPCRISNRL